MQQRNPPTNLLQQSSTHQTYQPSPSPPISKPPTQTAFTFTKKSIEQSLHGKLLPYKQPPYHQSNSPYKGQSPLTQPKTTNIRSLLNPVGTCCKPTPTLSKTKSKLPTQPKTKNIFTLQSKNISKTHIQTNNLIHQSPQPKSSDSTQD